MKLSAFLLRSSGLIGKLIVLNALVLPGAFLAVQVAGENEAQARLNYEIVEIGLGKDASTEFRCDKLEILPPASRGGLSQAREPRYCRWAWVRHPADSFARHR